MIRNLLEYHCCLYPLMQPADTVKLLYQHSFGVGHLITSEAAFRERLDAEAASVAPDPSVPLTVPIGNGLIRVMLNSPAFIQIPAGALTEACLKTAQSTPDTPEQFQENLRELETLTGAGLFSFSQLDLETWLTVYHAAGFPPVSHSEIYRRAYRPAYRVVKASLLTTPQFPDK